MGRGLCSSPSACEEMALERRFILKRNGLLVVIKEGDITKQGTDAVVNAANTHMLGGSGVDGAIHRAAGPRLLEACEKLPVIEPPETRLATGDALLQPGFNLAKFIVPAVGPIYSLYEGREARRLLRSAYSHALNIADAEPEISSVSLPALSCGVYGFPPQIAAKILMAVLVEQDEKAVALDEVRVVLFGERMFDLFAAVAERKFTSAEGELQEGVAVRQTGEGTEHGVPSIPEPSTSRHDASCSGKPITDDVDRTKAKSDELSDPETAAKSTPSAGLNEL